ncbi:hypothetical protein ACVGWC_24030, partial [Enterobacter hormaechei]
MRRERILSCYLAMMLLIFSLSPGPLMASSNSPPDTFDACFNSAGARYQIEPLLLKAMAKGESWLRPWVT